MVRKAMGTESSCEDYVKEIAELLSKLKIDDPSRHSVVARTSTPEAG